MEIKNEFFPPSITATCPVDKLGGSAPSQEDTVVVEHPFTIRFTDCDTTLTTICSPSQLEALVVGHLLTQQYITRLDQLRSIYIPPTGEYALVDVSPSPQPPELEGRVLARPNITREAISRQARETLENSPLFQQTGALHTASLWRNGLPLYRSFDLGRHNAIDKVVGQGLLEGIPLEETVLFTSGRIPRDMVAKAIGAGIPVLASRSAPTAQGILLAKAHNLTLLGFVRGGSINCYHGSLPPSEGKSAPPAATSQP